MTFAMKVASGKRNYLKLVLVLGCLTGALLLATGCAAPMKTEAAPVTFSTPYQAVVLINNSVYYGKLSGWGTSNPVLTDVFYIMSKTDPTDPKKSSNVLIKRGKELHGPDKMYLNPSQIILVEPVGPDSKVAQLIAEANKQQ